MRSLRENLKPRPCHIDRVFFILCSSGELFAKCPVDDYPGMAVEGVLDSSRYFVLKIVDETGM